MQQFTVGQQVQVNGYWWPAMARRIGVVTCVDRVATWGGHWVRVHVDFDGERLDFAPEELEPAR